MGFFNQGDVRMEPKTEELFELLGNWAERQTAWTAALHDSFESMAAAASELAERVSRLEQLVVAAAAAGGGELAV